MRRTWKPCSPQVLQPVQGLGITCSLPFSQVPSAAVNLPIPFPGKHSKEERNYYMPLPELECDRLD